MLRLYWPGLFQEPFEESAIDTSQQLNFSAGNDHHAAQRQEAGGQHGSAGRRWEEEIKTFSYHSCLKEALCLVMTFDPLTIDQLSVLSAKHILILNMILINE